MTHEQQQAAQARCDAATKGPWFRWRILDETEGELDGEGALDWRVCAEEQLDGEKVCGQCLFTGLTDDGNDANFCANARIDLPLALAEIRRLEAEIERMKGMTA